MAYPRSSSGCRCLWTSTWKQAERSGRNPECRGFVPRARRQSQVKEVGFDEPTTTARQRQPAEPAFQLERGDILSGDHDFAGAITGVGQENEVRYVWLKDAMPFLTFVAGVNFSFGWRTISEEIALAYPRGRRSVDYWTRLLSPCSGPGSVGPGVPGAALRGPLTR